MSFFLEMQASSSPFAVPPPRIERDGIHLVVPRGADFSDRCFRCGAPSAGRAIVKYLHIDTNKIYRRPAGAGALSPALLILDIIGYGLRTIAWLLDRRRSRERGVSFGLCAKHRRRRWLVRGAAILGLPSGAALLIAALFDLSEWLQDTAIALGVALCGSGLVASADNADPVLAAESADLLWLSGAGKPFLDGLPVRGV